MNKTFTTILIIVLLGGGGYALHQSQEKAPSEEGVAQPSQLGSNYLGSYTITDADFGTNVVVTVDATNRTITSNALPNHETGEFPNPGNPNTISEQSSARTYPINPTWTGSATWAREPGVSINGVKFEPETNERVTCTTGETYRIEAKQELVNLGLDFNNAHVQPTGEYHYHGVSDAMVEAFDQGNDLVHVGFAADGYLIYYSKSAAYSSSYRLATEKRTGESCTYTTPNNSLTLDLDGSTPDGTYVSDWEYVDGLGDLDQCNGATIDGQYIYLMTDDYPFSGRCLNGEVAGGQGAPGQGGGAQGPPNGPAGGPAQLPR